MALNELFEKIPDTFFLFHITDPEYGRCFMKEAAEIGASFEGEKPLAPENWAEYMLFNHKKGLRIPNMNMFGHMAFDHWGREPQEEFSARRRLIRIDYKRFSDGNPLFIEQKSGIYTDIDGNISAEDIGRMNAILSYLIERNKPIISSAFELKSNYSGKA